MARQWTWHHPASLEEAARLLARYGEDAVLVAGGTAVCLSPPRKDDVPMIDLGRAGASEVELADGVVRIGAMVTPTILSRHPALQQVGAGMLVEAARAVGPRPVRNRATVGGNVIRAFPWSDFPPALLALGASFELMREGARRTLAADELLSAQPRLSLEGGELLSAVHVPASGHGRGSAFVKLAATAVDHALVSVAAALRVEAGRCIEARVVAGALTPLPQRLRAVESALEGQALTEPAIRRAADEARTVEVARDRRASADYRREVTTVLARRALAVAWRRAEGGVS